MQCAPFSRFGSILGNVVYKYGCMPMFLHIKIATYLHKYNFVNGEENIINFTPCKGSDVPENNDILEESINFYYKNAMLHTVHCLRYICYNEHLRV